MIKPILTVLMTVRNGEPYLYDAVASVLNQTYRNFRFLILDNASTDNTCQIIRSFNDPRIELVELPEDIGQVVALNQGLQMIDTPFIARLDADDIMAVNRLQKQVTFLDRNTDIAVVGSHFKLIDKNDKFLNDLKWPVGFAENLLYVLSGNNPVGHPGVMYRRDAILEVGNYDETFSVVADMDLWLRLYLNGYLCDNINDYLTSYRIHDKQDSASNTEQKIRLFNSSVKKFIESVLESEIDRNYIDDYMNTWIWRKKPLNPYSLQLATDTFEKLLIRYANRYKHPFTNELERKLAKKLLNLAKHYELEYPNNIRYVNEVANRYMSEPDKVIERLKKSFKTTLKRRYPFTYQAKRILHIVNSKTNSTKIKKMSINTPLNITAIKNLSLNYTHSLRVYENENENFIGHKHSHSTSKPVLYSTIACLLLKHLYGYKDDKTQEELELILKSQSDDGLFRDPVISCKEAEIEDWWGWRHLTLHALMTLALYDIPAQKEIRYLDWFANKNYFRKYLESRDWGKRVAWTSNELQNIGVMLQYARDYQGSQVAGELMEMLYKAIGEHQDPYTGLYGHQFDTPEDLSLGVQAGYHFWLLYFYDNRPINHVERIIDSVLKTQNIFGGYGVKWNSSACEDIDSIDPLVRFSRLTDYRHEDVQASLSRALPAILQNLNGDGGWVFRRNEALKIVHPQMSSAANESNMFYTWFRTLGMAFCLTGLEQLPKEFEFEWTIAHVPGHQFL